MVHSILGAIDLNDTNQRALEMSSPVLLLHAQTGTAIIWHEWNWDRKQLP